MDDADLAFVDDVSLRDNFLGDLAGESLRGALIS
jgi:hypothetical protein